MRIIAGKYGGLTLESPKVKSIHPMGERIRGAIFNSLYDKIIGATVLDLFSGSGSVGLEALSRGAKAVYLVDKDRRATDVIRSNVKKLTDEDQSRAKIFPVSVLKFFEQNPTLRFDFIFADPPYDDVDIKNLLSLGEFIHAEGALILSIPKQMSGPDLPGLKLNKTSTYADARIAFYTKE